MHPGQQLRARRDQLGLSLREVEAASISLAQRHGAPDLVLHISRISDIESKGIVPNIHRLYSLAVIYRCDLGELFSWYGIDVSKMTEDLAQAAAPKTHIFNGLAINRRARVPMKVDPSFDMNVTCDFGRMVEQWGTVPFSFLENLASRTYTYAYIGLKDFTMYPLLLPGSFLQVDERKRSVQTKQWASEFQRPIYFVEMRDEFTCCWCAVAGEKLTLQPYPLSPAAPRIVRLDYDAEILGQVVGLAMRLDEMLENPGPARTKLSLTN
jgi:transcriptional regulator with XRE-family HTH domain